MREIIVDNFAGGGGASTGIEMALNCIIDVAINHDPAAIAMHKVNHPQTKHYCESVWEVDPREVAAGRPVGLCWLSPDCKHFSKAKGGKPVEKNIRGLAWVAVRWAATVRPRVIILENVEEFKTWGPLRPIRDNNTGRVIKADFGERKNKQEQKRKPRYIVAEKGEVIPFPLQVLEPHPDKKGKIFRQFVKALENLGYQVEYKELRACDYGAPTSRKRFFMIARCDGQPIVWPEATHGDPNTLEVAAGILKPWHTAGEIINWELRCPSIFERKKPLAENTMRRIARGIKKFVLDNPSPFIVSIGQTGFGGDKLSYSLDHPLTTITTSPGHFAEVRAFLVQYYGASVGQSASDPLYTVTTKDRFGLVTVQRQDYQIVDIGMRMLEPRELFRAQSFPDSYEIERDIDGKVMSRASQVARCGNSVPPLLARTIVEANVRLKQEIAV